MWPSFSSSCLGLCVSWTCMSISFTKLGKFSVIIFKNRFPVSCSLYSSSTPMMQRLVYLKSSQRLLKLASFLALEPWSGGPGVGPGTFALEIFHLIFIHHMCVWDQPVLHLCPSYQSQCVVSLILYCRTSFLSISASSEWCSSLVVILLSIIEERIFKWI